MGWNVQITKSYNSPHKIRMIVNTVKSGTPWLPIAILFLLFSQTKTASAGVGFWIGGACTGLCLIWPDTGLRKCDFFLSESADSWRLNRVWGSEYISAGQTNLSLSRDVFLRSWGHLMGRGQCRAVLSSLKSNSILIETITSPIQTPQVRWSSNPPGRGLRTSWNPVLKQGWVRFRVETF